MCTNCNTNKPIVNKRHNLCDDCNFMRLHDGKSKAEVYSERQKNKQQDWTASLPKARLPIAKINKPIKQQTRKQSIRSQQLAELKKSIEIKALQNDQYYCWGCGQAKGGLDKSHILSVGQRKDLELVKENINLFCRSCHILWESGDLIKMLPLLTFEKDFEFIKQNDSTTYNKLLDAIQYLIAHDHIIEVQQEIISKAQKIFAENDFIIK